MEVHAITYPYQKGDRDALARLIAEACRVLGCKGSGKAKDSGMILRVEAPAYEPELIRATIQQALPPWIAQLRKLLKKG